MLEVDSLGSVYSGIKFKGPNKHEVSDTFGSNGKTGAILYVGTDTYESWKDNNYKQNMTITLVAANSQATVANIPVEFTVIRARLISSKKSLRPLLLALPPLTRTSLRIPLLRVMLLRREA